MSPMRPAATRPEPVGERPPIGCDADTMKLFVGHISPHMVREDLDPILDQYGQVELCMCCPMCACMVA